MDKEIKKEFDKMRLRCSFSLQANRFMVTSFARFDEELSAFSVEGISR